MKLLNSIVVFVWLSCSCFAQGAPKINATLSELKVEQCRRYSKKYTYFDLYLLTKFTIENTSERSLVMAKQVDVVPVIRVASSEEDASRDKFLFTWEDDYLSRDEDLPAPKRTDFIVLAPGEKHSFTFASKPLSATTAPLTVKEPFLRPGRYWVQFGFKAIPAYLQAEHGEFSRFVEQWRGAGELTDELFWTKPFPLDVEYKTHAESCSMR